MLAGNGLASPLARVRANQATREAERAKVRSGARSVDYVRKAAIAQEAELLSRGIEAEIDRLSIDRPTPREGEVVVYGYVRQGGKPAAGMIVGLVGKAGDARVETQTAKNGSFTLACLAPEPLALTVRKGDKILSAEKQPLYRAAPQAYYRLVELEAGREPAPCQVIPPKQLESPPKRDPIKRDKSGLAGMTLNQALIKLDQKNLRLAMVLLTPAEEHDGHVLAIKLDEQTREVTLEVGVRDRNSDRLDMLAVLIAHQPQADRIGIGTIEKARASLRDAEMESLGDARDLLELSDLSLGRKAKVGNTAEGRVLRELLGNALDKIEAR
jgi:hypothetical protein